MNILTSIAEKICMVLSDLIPIPEAWKWHPCCSDEDYLRTHLDHGQDFFQQFTSGITFEGKRVLDIGCGGCGLTAFCAQKGVKLSVGVDLDCEKSTKAIFGRKAICIELVKTDARQMPFKDGVFDIIVSRNVFEHIPQINVVLQECTRILKNDGALYLQFGPIWYSRHGGHLFTVIPIPWCHLLFPKQVLFNCIQKKHSTGGDKQKWQIIALLLE
jgi:ubiquinone/menaquinone biosynthesis C-methylase UbiE